MDKNGIWKLSAAFDVIWAYNSSGPWTNQHQMTINGRRDGFTRADLLGPAKQFGIRNASTIIEEVIEAVSKWSKVAERVGIAQTAVRRIAATHRLDWK
jgi:serine/threonine-protein kinase HipA